MLLATHGAITWRSPTFIARATMKVPKSMLFVTSVFIAGALFMMPAAAADSGTCHLTSAQISGTYGFSATGQALATIPDFVTEGPFAQVGTVTIEPTVSDEATIEGEWHASLIQQDSSGPPASLTFGGTFSVNRETCVGDFALAAPFPPTWGFVAVFVAHGHEARTIAKIPNVIISYTSAKKL
jgi:hypothetical protein